MIVQPDDMKLTAAELACQTTAVTDWSKTVHTDEKTDSLSDALKTNMELVVGTPKKRLSVVNDDDVLSEDFFTERTNRFHSCLSLISISH